MANGAFNSVFRSNSVAQLEMEGYSSTSLAAERMKGQVMSRKLSGVTQICMMTLKV